ncbi:MAG TPA: hypothetical protein VMV92_06295 [Streptosporangiaceae bacterium]|nr:hypothetical protein [Streptosporangiaceae bacterium]
MSPASAASVVSPASAASAASMVSTVADALRDRLAAARVYLCAVT